MRAHTTTAATLRRFAAAAVTLLAAPLISAGPAAAQAQSAPLPPQQDWRSCGSLLIKNASVTTQNGMFKVNLRPSIGGPKPPVDLAWSDLRNCVTFPNLKTLRHQFDCHAIGNHRSNDPVWNLESDRPPNGNWWNNVRQHKCNWGHSDGGGSSSA